MRLLEKHNALQSPFSPPSSFSPSPQPSRNIGEFGAARYFADYQTANKMQLFVAMKESFSGLLFFRTSHCKRKSWFWILVAALCNLYIKLVYITFYILVDFTMTYLSIGNSSDKLDLVRDITIFVLLLLVSFLTKAISTIHFYEKDKKSINFSKGVTKAQSKSFT